MGVGSGIHPPTANRHLKLVERTVARYQYNALHWRTIAEKFIGGSIDRRDRFTYSPQWQVLEQKVWETPAADPAQDGAPTWTAQQFWGKRGLDDAVCRRVDRGDGAGGPPDGDYADAGDGSWYYVTDNLRSVVAVVDAAGSLVERVVYGPFGKSQHHFAGDVNGDGIVDFFDLQLVLADVGKTASGISQSLDDGGPGNPVGYAG